MAGAGSGGTPKAAASQHYAWAQGIASTRATLESLGVDTSPRPADGTAAAAAAAPAGGASAWNAAGTWEEKNVTARATPMLREALTASRAGGLGPGGALALTLRAATADGSASTVFSRGRARLAFEYTLTADWALVDGAGVAGATGTLTLEEVADTDSDVFADMRVTAAPAPAPPAAASGASGYAGPALTRDAAVALVRGAADHLRAVIRAWADAVVKG